MWYLPLSFSVERALHYAPLLTGLGITRNPRRPRGGLIQITLQLCELEPLKPKASKSALFTQITYGWVVAELQLFSDAEPWLVESIRCLQEALKKSQHSGPLFTALLVGATETVPSPPPPVCDWDPCYMFGTHIHQEVT